MAKVNKELEIQKALAVFFMGLSKVGLLEDPYIADYRARGKYYGNNNPSGMSINGLMTTQGNLGDYLKEGEIFDGGIPPQGEICYVAKYTLSPLGIDDFYAMVRKRRVSEGILPKEFAQTIKDSDMNYYKILLGDCDWARNIL
jgi:hypothetical protein